MKRKKRGTSYPKCRTVKGSPPKDRAYVTAGRMGRTPASIGTLAIGVLSPAYHNEPRGVHLTLSQAETFAKAILAKVKACRARNKEAKARFVVPKVMRQTHEHMH